MLKGKGDACQEMNNTKTRPQVKTRKWVLKKNGLYGWITSVREAKSSEKKPQNSIPSGRGVEKKKKKNC